VSYRPRNSGIQKSRGKKRGGGVLLETEGTDLASDGMYVNRVKNFRRLPTNLAANRFGRSSVISELVTSRTVHISCFLTHADNVLCLRLHTADPQFVGAVIHYSFDLSWSACHYIAVYISSVRKGKVVSLYNISTCRWNGATAPHIRNFCTTWRWVVVFAPTPLPPPLPSWKAPRHPLNRFGGPLSRSGHFEA